MYCSLQQSFFSVWCHMMCIFWEAGRISCHGGCNPYLLGSYWVRIMEHYCEDVSLVKELGVFFSSDWTIVACLNYRETSWASITWIQTLYLYKKKSLYNFASGPLPGVWLALLLCSLINVVSSAYRLWSNANWLIKEIHIWGLCQCAKHICLRKVELEAGKV